MTVKSLTAAAVFVLAAGTAQAQFFTGAAEATQELERCAEALGVSVNRCQAMQWALSGAKLPPLSDEERAAAISSSAMPLYGGLPDAADPDEVRKQRQRGEQEDAAMPPPPKQYAPPRATAKQGRRAGR